MFVLQIATLAVAAIKETHADLTWPLYKEGGRQATTATLAIKYHLAESVHMLFKWALRLHLQE